MAFLVRPLRGRVLAGVCLAIARVLRVPPTVVRVLWIILSFVPGPLWVAYVLLWVILPAERATPRR